MSKVTSVRLPKMFFLKFQIYAHFGLRISNAVRMLNYESLVWGKDYLVKLDPNLFLRIFSLKNIKPIIH